MIRRRDNPLLVEWTRALGEAGISGATLLSERYEPKYFGNGEASFQWGSIILWLTRDRDEDAVQIAPSFESDERFQWDDVCVTFGWREVNNIVARTHSLPLKGELVEIMRRAPILDVAFGAKQFASTREAVNVSKMKREAATLKKLERLADNYAKTKRGQ